MTALFDRFRDFLVRNCLPETPEKILLAVSGGIDSMVMMHLFHQTGYSCEVAHCNFQLRGADSDADEHFVQQMAFQYNFPFHATRFLTEEFANDHAISIQMAARQLRYKWFDELIEEKRFSVVASGHHANDVAETMLLNLVKGTGLAGMHGIRAVYGNVIRPLLFAQKQELEEYAAHYNLSWRDDASNSGVHYQRNKIRHEVLPVLEEINPNVTGALTRHAKLMTGYEALLESYISRLEASMIREAQRGGIKSIALDQLLASPAPAILLYHFLKPYGAGSALCDEILAAKHTGTEFYSNGFRIVRDRETVTIFDPSFLTVQEYRLQEHDKHLDLPYGQLQMITVTLDKHLPLASLPDFADRNTAYIDVSGLRFPLVIRKWHKGDSFHPLGMKGRKLLSDFFIDSRFSSAMKEVVYLLMSEGEVVWVIGHRIDERFKISETTKKSLRFIYYPHDNI